LAAPASGQTANAEQFKPSKDILLNSSRNSGKSWPHGRVTHFSGKILAAPASGQTANAEQFKPSKDILLNSSRNSGKSWPHGRVTHFSRATQKSQQF
jgi:hypothetical protein